MGRLAPTPSGHLHLGNVLAFGAAWLSARKAGGRLLLRFEDVDRERARAEIESSIRDDLQWLGLAWDEEVPPQRDRSYPPWRERLSAWTYRCTCTRKEIRAAGGVYPGTCREAKHPDGAVRFRLPDGVMRVLDRKLGVHRADPRNLGDPVLQRRDGAYAYPLAVVADDLADGVTEVVRGADLLDPTIVQIALWRALGATPPTWLHVPVIVGEDGRKLSKSHGSTEIRWLRAAGWTAEDVWRRALPWLGIEAASLAEAVAAFDPAAGPRGPLPCGPTSR